MRIFSFAILLALSGTLSAQAPVPKPKTPAPAAPTTPAQVNQPAPAPGAPLAQGFDKVVLSVGDEKMTAGEFEKFVETLPEQYRAAAKGAGKRQVAEQLVSLKTLAQE